MDPYFSFSNVGISEFISQQRPG